mmetsp:Transcript_15704/g.47339  ORF Transcript_15704/g.47339 Transcript_15704/m.47339 type:complete len:381 (-) Transcript_15704:153-1295(-)
MPGCSASTVPSRYPALEASFREGSPSLLTSKVSSAASPSGFFSSSSHAARRARSLTHSKLSLEPDSSAAMKVAYLCLRASSSVHSSSRRSPSRPRSKACNGCWLSHRSFRSGSSTVAKISRPASMACPTTVRPPLRRATQPTNVSRPFTFATADSCRSSVRAATLSEVVPERRTCCSQRASCPFFLPISASNTSASLSSRAAPRRLISSTRASEGRAATGGRAGSSAAASCHSTGPSRAIRLRLPSPGRGPTPEFHVLSLIAAAISSLTGGMNGPSVPVVPTLAAAALSRFFLFPRGSGLASAAASSTSESALSSSCARFRFGADCSFSLLCFGAKSSKACSPPPKPSCEAKACTSDSSSFDSGAAVVFAERAAGVLRRA